LIINLLLLIVVFLILCSEDKAIVLPVECLILYDFVSHEVVKHTRCANSEVVRVRALVAILPASNFQLTERTVERLQFLPLVELIIRLELNKAPLIGLALAALLV
jgi:hypothetical protein